MGDEILVQVANVIKANIREKDIGARWGGEELAIYLPMVSLDDGTAIAKRLIKKVEENSNPRVTVSCGVSYWYKDLAHSYQSLFKQADEALYVAKTTGKNRVVAQTDHHEAR
ncbi:GGDEF domain-containing protein [Neobacillus sp. OS1-32]|uniref:GGDEF domain-containing protein n=1 Tax=Neobacillus sp. OS1-32 TaxID=3070682 RepID=UPI0027E01939|nr:GGDEF domain-containing protein [Neobacillus sp. OS1-32]WML30437.1 GGDEF domain-containing protein [Neobacillus sp. OS1-32]